MTDTTSAAPSLEPCPFCGAHASFHNDTDSPIWFAGCSGVDCEIEPHCYAESETAAAAAWNRRAQLTPPAVVEPLTDDQVAGIIASIAKNAARKPILFAVALARAIEAAHGIKGDSHGLPT